MNGTGPGGFAASRLGFTECWRGYQHSAALRLGRGCGEGRKPKHRRLRVAHGLLAHKLLGSIHRGRFKKSLVNLPQVLGVLQPVIDAAGGAAGAVFGSPNPASVVTCGPKLLCTPT